MDASLCPKGHASTEADYCSECGARIEGSASFPALSNLSQPAPFSAATCPECGAPREPTDVVFCEICGYNFATGARGQLPMPPPPPTPPPSVAAWEVLVCVDPALREAGSPEPPEGIGPFTFPLGAAASLVGRKSEARAVFPEIALFWDDAVSHRHALLQIDAAGTPVLRDIGASNGTRLNGAEVQPMTDIPLGDGDAISLGHWTRITIKAIY